MPWLLLSAFSLLALLSGASAYEVRPLAATAQAACTQRLCPLPKSVALTGTVTVPLAALRLRLPEAPSDLDRNLLAELQTALGDRAGAKLRLAGPTPPTAPAAAL